MKKIVCAIALLVLTFTTCVSAAFAAEPYSFESIPLANDESIFIINEPGYEASQYSSLTVQPGPGAQGDGRIWYHCASMDDTKCTEKNLVPDLAWLILPNCSTGSKSACVQSLEVAKPGEEFQEAKYLRMATGGIRIAADSKHNVLEGATPSLYEAAAVPNAGATTNYAVSIRVSEHMKPGGGVFEFGDVIANVIPYQEVSGEYKAPYIDSSKDAKDQYWFDWKASSCIWVEDGKCGIRQDFAEGTKVRLKFQIPNKIGGWFSGRMKNPLISVSAINGTTNSITVESESVRVPQFAVVEKKKDITDTVRNYNIGRGGSKNGEFWAVTAGGPGGEDTFKFIDYFRAKAADTARGQLSYWSLRTIGAASGGGNRCISDTSKVLGVVTTNSMAYDTGSPAYVNGFLNYKVAGLHYQPDGKTAVEGTYDLVMRSETARCLYGFTSAPISATISVVGSGDTSVGTTVVSEKNGWLKMAAYGFSFSQKTIQVKVTQQSTKTKITITCVKGKLTKKVIAVNAKCPSGYKAN